MDSTNGEPIGDLETPVRTKLCRTCHVIKPITEYSRGNTSHDKYRHSCKPCVVAIRRSKIDIYPEGKRLCRKCGIVKDLEADFAKNKAYYTGYYFQCKACTRIYNTEYRKTHPKVISDAGKRAYNRRTVDAKEFARLERYERYLANKAYAASARSSGCIDCGEKHPACLDFDHIGPKGEKHYSIARAVWTTSLKSIKKEIEKCVVRCSNCHRKRHWVERNEA